MIKPRALEPGDRIALIAPASAFVRADLEAGIEELTRIGFEPVYDERIFERAMFTAGTASTRAALLHDAWRDPTIRGIIAIRGGYGSAHLLPLLDRAVMREAAKVFVGYSDITALLSLHLQHGIVCFHGAMVEGRIARGGDGYDRSSFLAAVAEPVPVGELAPTELDIVRPGEARGVLVGGTMTQLTALLGTPWAYQPPEGCVLFLEDVGERPYRIDRMLTQLAQAGVLARAAALVFGEFPGCVEPGNELTARDAIRAFVDEFRGPVLFGFPSGHTTGPTWTLPFGVEVSVVTSPKPAVIVEEAAVQ